MFDRSFVYVIGHDTGPQKIGHSGSPANRARTLKEVGQPHFSVHFRMGFDRVDAVKVEALAHWLLADRALGKERFAVTPQEAESAIIEAARRFEIGERAPRVPRKPEEEKCTERLGILMPQSLIDRIDDERRKLRPIPSFGTMVKTLVSRALESEGH